MFWKKEPLKDICNMYIKTCIKGSPFLFCSSVGWHGTVCNPPSHCGTWVAMVLSGICVPYRQNHCYSLWHVSSNGSVCMAHRYPEEASPQQGPPGRRRLLNTWAGPHSAATTTADWLRSPGLGTSFHISRRGVGSREGCNLWLWHSLCFHTGNLCLPPGAEHTKAAWADF